MSNSPCEICSDEHAKDYAIYTMPLELCTITKKEYDVWLCCDCIEFCEEKAKKVKLVRRLFEKKAKQVNLEMYCHLTGGEFNLLKEAVMFACQEWHDNSLLSICNADEYAKTQAEISKVKAVIAKLESQWGGNAN